MSHSNPFSKPEPWAVVSKGYSQTTMSYLSQYSRDALSAVKLNDKTLLLDVACGPGTVARLIHSNVAHMDCLDFSSEMISILDEFISSKNILNVHTTVGDGQQLPFGDNKYDVATSMFGLMFFPDRLKGFSELYRCLKPGGKVVVTSWGPVDESPAMKLMFGAIKAAMPDAPKLDLVIENLEKKDIFEKELTTAGFTDIVLRPSTHYLRSDSVEDLWDFMVRGSAPIAMMKKTNSEEEWLSLEKKVKTFITNSAPQFPIKLGAKAWIGTGIKE